MGKLLAYSGTTTKIRAIRSRLLTMDNYRELASMHSVTEALAYLKKQPAYQQVFADVDEATLHRNQIEKMLTNAIYMDFQRIYRFATVRQRKFMDLYFHRYEIYALKTCMRMVFDHRDVSLDLRIFEEFFQKHSQLDLRRLSSSKNLEEFVNNLKGTIYYDAITRLSNISNPTLFDYEMSLDLFYFKWFWDWKDKKIFDKKERKIFMDSYGVKMDLLNIQWIYRSKKFFQMPAPDIYALLIPVQYHVKKNEIQALVEASSMEDFQSVLKKTYYGRHYEYYDMDTLGKTYNRIRWETQRKNARRDPYSVAILISYLFEKEHEIEKITIALECVRYGLTQDQILEYVDY